MQLPTCCDSKVLEVNQLFNPSLTAKKKSSVLLVINYDFIKCFIYQNERRLCQQLVKVGHSLINTFV